VCLRRRKQTETQHNLWKIEWPVLCVPRDVSFLLSLFLHKAGQKTKKREKRIQTRGRSSKAKTISLDNQQQKGHIHTLYFQISFDM